jgi:hypothetical protein
MGKLLKFARAPYCVAWDQSAVGRGPGMQRGGKRDHVRPDRLLPDTDESVVEQEDSVAEG